MTQKIRVRFIVPGDALGRLIFAGPAAVNFKDKQPFDASREIEHFRGLVNRIADDLTRVYEELSNLQDDSPAEIVETHRLLILDEGFHDKVLNLITAEFISAEKAAGKVLGEIAGRLSSANSSYLKQRADDIIDLIQQFQNHTIEKGSLTFRKFTSDTILVVGKLFPSTVLGCRDSPVKGIITGEGVPTSHAAILAKSLGIPVAVDVEGAVTALQEGQVVFLESKRKVLIPEPDENFRHRYQQQLSKIRAKQAKAHATAPQPAFTADGVRVSLLANIDKRDELELLQVNKIDGVGLFRTEFLYMSEQKNFPSFETQKQWYGRVVKALNGKPVTIRIVDIGGDKFLPYFSLGVQENPYLGLRGPRVFRFHPELLVTQLRAIFEAAETGLVRILYPMVNTIEDLNFLKSVYKTVRRDFDFDLLLGIMVETPAAVFQIENLLQEVDFISIGTNDLVQYTLTVDRNNQNVMDYFQPTLPVIIQMLAKICETARNADKPVSICGELASDPYWTPLLLGLGLREFSLNLLSADQIRQTMAKLDTGACQSLVANLLKQRHRAEVEKMIETFHEDIEK